MNTPTNSQLACQLATVLWQTQGALALPAMLAQQLAHGSEQPSPVSAVAVSQLLSHLQVLVEEAVSLAVQLEGALPDEADLPPLPEAGDAAAPTPATGDEHL